MPEAPDIAVTIAPSDVPVSTHPGSGTTGRYLVLFQEGASVEGVRAMTSTAGLQFASVEEVGASDWASGISENTAMLFEQLGVAVLSGENPDRVSALSAASGTGSPLMAIEQEQIVYAVSDLVQAGQPSPLVPTDADELTCYLRGYQEGVAQLVASLLARKGLPPAGSAAALPALLDESQATWGLQLTQVVGSRYSGKGIKVAVLDTGLDLTHPDFQGRQITSQSFVAGQTVQDGHGHGTHCLGTACGPLKPGLLPRFGIAYEAEIFVGKVMNNAGQGVDGDILAGIQWAMTNGCQIVSLSLEAPAVPGRPFSTIFETVARRALNAGTLLLAAAGNESHRNLGMRPAEVGHPANCPSILSVAAIDSQRKIAVFSNSGKVGIAAPGVNIRSTWPVPRLYNTISGTSMAAPHVAGIAALQAQAMQEAGLTVTGQSLLDRLLQTVQRLDLPISDIGAGLVQAP